jgi:hypothetical protein
MSLANSIIYAIDTTLNLTKYHEYNAQQDVDAIIYGLERPSQVWKERSKVVGFQTRLHLDGWIVRSPLMVDDFRSVKFLFTLVTLTTSLICMRG